MDKRKAAPLGLLSLRFRHQARNQQSRDPIKRMARNTCRNVTEGIHKHVYLVFLLLGWLHVMFWAG
jgi:hypothetical protein